VNAYWLIPLVLAGTVVAVLQQRRARQRSQVIEAWAQARGLAYRPGPDRKLARAFLEFAALSRGDEHVATNICQGLIAGREVWAFDLTWKARDNDGETNLTAVLVKTDFPLIPLRIRRETAIERLGEAFGLNDIDFESAAFSDRFHVTAADRKFAHEVIHPRMMEFLLANGTWPVELAGWHCLVWSGGRLPPRHLDTALALAEGVVERIPDHVRRDLLGRPRGKA
jgi:hypothetical protein